MTYEHPPAEPDWMWDLPDDPGYSDDVDEGGDDDLEDEAGAQGGCPTIPEVGGDE